MTTKEAYILLGKPTTLKRELARLQEKRNALWLSCLPGAIQYDTDRVKSSPADKLPDRFAEIDQIDRDIERLEDERIHLIQSLYRLIVNGLPYGREMIVLQQYYLAGQSMSYIAEHLDVTYQHSFRIRRKAVEMFAELTEGSEGYDKRS